MFSVAFPVLLSVTVCAALVMLTAALANVRLVGVIEASGALPSPTRLMKCGEPAALSPNVIVPNLEPGVVGVKVIVSAQLAAAATELLQLSVSAKSPTRVLLLMFR